jgi:hypothetical protein
MISSLCPDVNIKLALEEIEAFLYPSVAGSVIASEIPLGVDNKARAFTQSLFEERIVGHKRNAVVATFEYQVDLGDHTLHLGQPCGVMSEEIGPWDGVQVRVHLAWNEGGHDKVFEDLSILSDGVIDAPGHEDRGCCRLCLSIEIAKYVTTEAR